MTTWIALFRGVNVGGHNKLPMRDLADVLTQAGACHVKTYIQSGNVVFDHAAARPDEIAPLIETTVQNSFGFMPKVHLLSVGELQKAIAANPYKQAESEPKTLHLFFLASEPGVLNKEAWDKIKAESEQYALIGSTFYLHAPDGIGRSKLAAKAEALLNVSATARNWRTVTKVLELATE
jgi:uncharacterized protein (DUF1697 family)